MLESELWTAHRVRAEFMTLQQIATHCSKQADGTLVINGSSNTTPVSVVYFRAGYTPDDYPTEVEWNTRALIEHSNAIKCPTVGYQLTGAKAIQAALCLPLNVERFLPLDQSTLLRQCFAEQYSLSAQATTLEREAVDKAIESAIADNGKNWVLKPQREGGGNNLYGTELKNFLVQHKNTSVLNGAWHWTFSACCSCQCCC